MNKPKILFYGNCQIGAISEIFRTHQALKDKFTVLNSKNYQLANQSYHAVANFLLFTEGKNNPSQIERIFSDADIVIFQAIDNNTVPEYCLTKNIIPNFKGLSICIPSFWYSGYFGFPYKFAMLDIFYYLNELNLSNEEALHILLNEPIPIAKDLFEYYHNISISGLQSREKSQSTLYNLISIQDWLLNTYKNKLLCYNHSHTTPAFFEFIVNKILNKINCSIESINFSNFNFRHPGPDGRFLPTKFKFFNDIFPDLSPLSELEISQYNNFNQYNSNQSEIFCKQGMHYVKNNKVIDDVQLINHQEVKNILGIK